MGSRQREYDVTLEVDRRSDALVKIRVPANIRATARQVAQHLYELDHPSGPKVVGISKIAYVPNADRHHVETP